MISPKILTSFFNFFQMDFDFVETHRVKEFSFRPVSRDDSEDEQLGAGVPPTMEDSERRLKTTQSKVRPQRHSVWNVDGEIIDEPAIHVRYIKYRLS